ncbi:MAG: ribosome silencing factor [SAR324 cluster bacterium]|nr:ribosome silencing factor [SAR324 cluster bacterium]
MNEQEKAKELIRIVQDVKAEEILLFDVNGHSSITDYILICQGRSQGHVKGIADRVQEEFRKIKIKPMSIEGYSEGSWILMDYDHVIIHIFHPETRAYYNLEGLHEGIAAESF